MQARKHTAAIHPVTIGVILPRIFTTRLSVIVLALLVVGTGHAETRGVDRTAGQLIVDTPVPPGELGYSTQYGQDTEVFKLPAAVLQAFGKSRVGQRLLAMEFPTVPGLREPVAFTRYDVYAPGARIFATDGNRHWEVPRSKRLYFLGRTTTGSNRAIGLSVDPANGRLHGMMLGHGGAYEIEHEEGRGAGWNRIRLEQAHPEAARIRYEGCGSEGLPAPDFIPSLVASEAFAGTATASASASASAATHTAVIAIDTDSEFNLRRFNNDTNAAAVWIADLFAEMNVMYEMAIRGARPSGVALRLLQGTTILRINNDPYIKATTSEQLTEFGNYWQSNLSRGTACTDPQGPTPSPCTVPRTAAALLSGKSPSGRSASGIAWLGSICETQSNGGGYSVTQIFTERSVNVLASVRLVAHELGHNFGAKHTHCYSPPVDTCYNAEPGCYSGIPSCPVDDDDGNQGSIMSYCHFSLPNGANCGDSDLEFHPRIATTIRSLIEARIFPGCIEPIGASSVGDIDANGTTDPRTDGRLLERYLFGLRGAALGGSGDDNAIASGAPPIITEIESYLEQHIADRSFDIDGNNTVDALTDGVMVIRYLSGLRGSSVTNGAIVGNPPPDKQAEMLTRLGVLFP